jgi:hypothetical protein
MVKFLSWLLWTYALLKLIHLVLSRRPSDRQPTIRERLSSGEPILFTVAFVLSVPVPMLISWQLHRGYTQGLEQATDCYGKIAAASALPSVKNNVGPWRLYEAADRADALAGRAGALLAFEHAAVKKALSNKKQLYARRFAAPAAADTGKSLQAEAEVRQCLKILPEIELSPSWL